MKTYKLSNPILKSDIIDDVFSAESSKDAAKNAFKVLAKYMVTTKSNRFIFSLKDINTEKIYHFDGQKKVVKKGKAVLNIKKFNLSKTGGGENMSISSHFKKFKQSGGGKRSKVSKKKSSKLSDSDSISDNLLKELSIDSNDLSSDLSNDHVSVSSNENIRESSNESSNVESEYSSKGGHPTSSNKSGKSKDKTFEEWLRRRYLFPANTYFFYDPIYYNIPSYTSYVFERNVFIPNLYYSLYPYWTSILPWIQP